jgi:catechol 2,3-dioxygenase
MAFAALGTVHLQVASLERSLPFYQDVLGLVVAADFRTGGRRVVTLGVASEPEAQVLVELSERPGARPVPRGGRLGLYHVALLLPDRASLGALVRHVADQRVPVGLADHLYSQSVYLFDPDGLGIEVYADQPKDTWIRKDGQIVGAVEPLDVEPLVALAGGHAWRAAPPGTTIGHVHLSVGDLAAAGAFYVDGLGFDPVNWSFPGALFVSAAGYHHHVGLNTWAARAPMAADEDARLLCWDLALEDHGAVSRAERRLASAGASVRREGGDLLATDPWGIVVRVRPRN